MDIATIKLLDLTNYYYNTTEHSYTQCLILARLALGMSL